MLNRQDPGSCRETNQHTTYPSMDGKTEALVKNFEKLMQRMETAVERLERVEKIVLAPKGGSVNAVEEVEEDLPPFYTEYEEFMKAHFPKLLELSKTVGEATFEAMTKLETGFSLILPILRLVALCKKPSDEEFGPHVQPIGAIMSSMPAPPFTDEQFTIQAIGNAAELLSWVINSRPADHIKESGGSVEFYVNRVRRSGKHADWCKAMTLMLKALRTYTLDHFKTGMKWNHEGVSITAVGKKAAPKPVAPKAALAAPRQLKKIDRKKLKAAEAPAPAPAPAPKPKARARRRGVPTGTARFELVDDARWMIEFQRDATNLTIDGEIHHTVNLFGCSNTLVRISGKINAVSITHCENVAVIVDSVISEFSMVKVKKTKVQVNKVVPTIQIEESEGVELHFSPVAVENTEVVTTHTSAIAIYPIESEEDIVYVCPVSFSNKIIGGKLVSAPVEGL
eukprot:gnl/Dysnectes_brevis/371_a413_3981.p1 GENE.gnl/Dysnectes_brevis/371_a413_3981~~gnl/Dysnectes_brevis/371_a413_3981.p1  ORF type:complete len:453 (-),score=183.04 gnl/Dysnectes_brevis/371_a413_3981:103-1461(-)